MKTYYSFENGGHRVMADDEEGRYTIADCMDEATARSIAFMLNYEDIEQILQSHTEEQEMALKTEAKVKELEEMLLREHKKFIDEASEFGWKAHQKHAHLCHVCKALAGKEPK